jgi:hypothetical protein
MHIINEIWIFRGRYYETAAFSDMTPCNFVDGYQRFERRQCFHFQGILFYSKDWDSIPVSVYQITRQYIPQDRVLQTQHLVTWLLIDDRHYT